MEDSIHFYFIFLTKHTKVSFFWNFVIFFRDFFFVFEIKFGTPENRTKSVDKISVKVEIFATCSGTVQFLVLFFQKRFSFFQEIFEFNDFCFRSIPVDEINTRFRHM